MSSCLINANASVGHEVVVSTSSAETSSSSFCDVSSLVVLRSSRILLSVIVSRGWSCGSFSAYSEKVNVSGINPPV